jgi:hypothetical protein
MKWGSLWVYTRKCWQGNIHMKDTCHEIASILFPLVNKDYEDHAAKNK